MGNLGAPELLIILLIVFIFFGAKKIPEMAQGIGKGIREFRRAAKEVESEPSDERVITGGASGAATVACVYCNSQVPRDSKFCPSCGQSLEAKKCSKCGAVNPPGNKFCRDCGEKL
jgi:sec-independent protein translocase protein TatA